MSAYTVETVLSVRHWTDTLFSFTATRHPAFRYANGQFVMMGLETEGRPLLRAYSMVSANYDDRLEFLSIKVKDGPLTSRLQHIKERNYKAVKAREAALLAELRNPSPTALKAAE